MHGPHSLARPGNYARYDPDSGNFKIKMEINEKLRQTELTNN